MHPLITAYLKLQEMQEYNLFIELHELIQALERGY
jgi:hypothetical protein